MLFVYDISGVLECWYIDARVSTVLLNSVTLTLRRNEIWVGGEVSTRTWLLESSFAGQLG